MAIAAQAAPPEIVPNSGPLAGGNSAVITNNLEGYTFTNVTVDGIVATIEESGDGWARIVMPAALSPGNKAVVAQFAANPDVTIPGGYTYNAGGRIFGYDKVWAETVGMPADRARMAGGALNGALVVFGGTQGSYGGGEEYVQTNAYRFDGTNWTEVAGLPVAVAYHSSGVFQGRLYSIGGANDAYATYTNVYAFDGTNWTEVAGLPEPRAMGGADVYQGLLYMIGGYDGVGFATNVYAFDGTNWTEVAGLPEALGFVFARTLGDRLYAISGMNNSYATSTNVYAFDGTNWTLDATVPAFDAWSVGKLASAVFEDQINLFGHNTLEDWFRFDGTSWQQADGFLGYENSSGVALDDFMYSVGGFLGLESQTNVFRYPELAENAGVAPASGDWMGGYNVTITGTNLCNGADITNVTLCGVSVASIVSQSATQVVVIAAPSTQLGEGDVRTYSTSFGMGVESNAFEYEGAGLDVLGINNDVIASGEAPSRAKGSDFGYVLVGASRSYTFKLDNPGSIENEISGWAMSGSEAFLCDLQATPITLYDGDQLSFSIQYSPGDVGEHAATLFISNSSPVGVYTVMLAGAGAAIAPTNIGPWSGGNTITVSNGSFGTITNVLVGGTTATILDSGTDWFTIILPASSSAGTADIIVQTSDNDEITLEGIYTYRSAGRIFGGGANTHGVLCQYEFAGSLSDSLGNGSDMVPYNNDTSGYSPDGWYWTASDNPGGGLTCDGPANTLQGSNYTMRVQASFAEVNGWRRWMWMRDSDNGPYIYNGQLYPYGLDDEAGQSEPANEANTLMDYYLTRDSGTKTVTAWLVISGEVYFANSGVDNNGDYVTDYNGSRPVWGFFHDDSSVGESTTSGTVRHIWMWDQVLSSNQIADLYGGVETSGITPESGASGGGFTVTITGSNLGDGSDITSVTLCGIEVSSIDSQSATQIVVTAGASGAAVTGDVVVVSTSFGTTTRSNAFTYTEDPEPIAQPNIGPYGGGNSIVITNTAGTITNVLIGGSTASITGSGTDWVAVTVPSASVAGLTAVTIQRDGAGDITLTDAYTYRPQGIIGGTGEPGGWTAVAGLPADRSYCAAATLDNVVYSIGGINSSFQNTTNVYRFDGSSWTETAGLPEARNGMAAAALNGDLFAIGGMDGTAKTNVFRFDGSAWTEVAGLPAPRRYMNAATWNGAIYVVAGQSSGVHTNVFCFDGTNWTEVAGLPIAVNTCGVSPLNGALYACGGMADMEAKTNAYMYDGTNWTAVAGLPVGRSAMGCAALDDALYVYGGSDNTFMPQTNAFRFDGTAWSEIEGLPKANYLLGGAALGGMVYAIGGSDMSFSLTNVYRYAAAAETSGVEPSSGSYTGGYEVVISGTNLSSGVFGDVTSVTLCGVAATVESVSGSTQIVVTANMTLVNLTGDVVVVSTDFGTTTRTNAFTYTDALELIVQPDIGPYGGGNAIVISNTFGTITNVLIGGSTATITDSGADWVAVTVPSASSAGATTVTLQRDGAGDVILADAYTYRPQGQIGYTFPGPDMVYWTDRTQDKIGRIAADGSGETDLVTGLSNPRPIDTDGEYLYYGNNGGNPVIRCNLDGSGSTTLINENATALFVNDEYIYYTDWNTGVKRANKDGSGITTLISGSVLGGNTWGYQAIYVTDDTIYFGNYGDNKIYTRGLSGGATNVLHDLGGGGEPTSLYVDDMHVYIGNVNNSSGIVRTDLDGNNPTEIGSAGSYYDIAILGGKLYYVNSSADVGRMNLDGSGQVAIATNGAGTHGVAALASQVVVAGVDPSSGSDTGGYEVVISGTNLCNGVLGDVTSVTLRGVAASVVSVAGSTQIVVTAGASGSAGIGDVVVQSTDFGTTTKANAFTYEASEFTITASASANGSITPSGAVVVQAGTDQLFTFTADQWYEVHDVLVNGVSEGAMPSYNWQNVLANGTITVSFAEAYVTNNTPVPVPQTWMARFGLTNDMDTLVHEDLTGVGATTWQLYVMDANPTSGVGVLRLDNVQFDEDQRIEWLVSSNRVYTLYGSTNLHEGVTNWITGPFQPAESGMWSHDEPVADEERGYYRVKVVLP